jgi:hypothetical protein
MAIANGGLYDLCRPEIDSQVMGEFAQNGIEKHFFSYPPYRPFPQGR